MSDELYKTIGLNQQPNAMQGSPLQTPGITTPELIFRTIGSAMPPPGSLRVPNRIGGLIGGTAARIAGGFSTTLADELARQRLDPLQRRMAIAGQLQQMGTAASPAGPAAQLDPNTSFSVPEPDQLPPGPPLPMQVGAPKFDQRNIPVQERIAFADLIEPLQKMETAKVEQQLKEKMRDRAGYMTAGKSIIDLDAVGGPKAVYTEADTPGDIATNLPNKIAVNLATDPLTGKVDWEKAAEILKDLRTTPQGAEGRVYDDLVKKYKGDMTKIIPEYKEFLKDIALYRSQGSFTGQLDVRDTPRWKAMEEDIARLKAQGGAAGSPLETSVQTAITAITDAAGVAQSLKTEFTPQERASYVGYLGYPANQLAQVVKNDPKFARFQVLINRAKSQALLEGGKQLTALEAGIVFGYVPTGRELSPADFEAKLNESLGRSMGLIENRIKFSTTPRGQLGRGGAVLPPGPPPTRPPPRVPSPGAAPPPTAPRIIGIEEIK